MKTAETISQALKLAADKLSDLPRTNPRLEAEILLAHVLDKPRTHLFAWPENRLDGSARILFETLIERRLSGEPSAYLTGYREFWSLELKVTRDTLIPRPETELLVEQALTLIPAESTYRIADLGTGSGAISAAIASERPACRILATDISAAALEIARENFEKLDLGNVCCAQGQWCAALPAEDPLFDLIVSNPPYIASTDPHLTEGALPWEPAHALISGMHGLDDIHTIVTEASHHLIPGGWLLLEHGYDQGEQVRHMLNTAGFQLFRTFRDLSGRERLSQGQRSL